QVSVFDRRVRQLGCEVTGHDGRRDQGAELGTQQGADLDPSRAAFVRTIRTRDTGRERPGSPCMYDSGGRQAGSLTPLSAPTPLFFTRPGRQNAPADEDADRGASAARCESSRDE